MRIPAGEIAEVLTALIRAECVNDGSADSGNEARAVEVLSGYLGEPDVVVEPHPGRTSAVWRVSGRSEDAPRLTLMGHTDVVPVNPDGWLHDPFGGERHDGFIWGRGAVDMLNQTSSMAAVFKRYRTGEFPAPPGDLVYFAVADEEGGGSYGATHVLDTVPEAVECEYLLTEIAMPHLATPRGPGLPVTVAEKGPHWTRLTSTGTPGHGSQPYATDNALVPLADAIGRLGRVPMPVEITPEWRAFVDALGLDEDTRSRWLDPDQIDRTIDRIAVDDPGLARWIHACTHLTLTPSLLQGGMKANMVPDHAAADIDIRTLPGQDEQSVHDHFRKALGPDYDEFEFEPILTYPASSSPTEGPLWDAIAAAAASMGTDRLIPAMIPVTTDARFFRIRGTVAYGVGYFDERVSFGDLLSMFHGHNERITEESLGLHAQLLDRTLEAFWENIE